MKKVLITMFILAATTTINARVISGVSVIDWSSQYNDGYGECYAVRVADGSGFNETTGYHTTVGYCIPGTMWLTSSGTTGYLEFDLGAIYTLDKIKVWNLNMTDIGQLPAGVKKMHIIITDGIGNPVTDLGEFTLTIGAGSSTVDFGQVIDLQNPTNVRYIMFDITENYGSTFVGLSEVRFYDDNPNERPIVNASADQRVWIVSGSAIVDVNGTVVDDSLPNPPCVVTTTWSKVSGPGTVVFANANALHTTATITVAGTYVLNLNVTDGELSADDTVTLDIKAEGYTGLIGHWPLDGNANDISGYGNNGTYTVSPTWTAGQVGQAMQLGGTAGEGLIIPNETFFDVSEFTVVAWFKYTNQSAPLGAAFVVDKRGTDQAGWRIMWYNSPDYYFMSYLGNAGARVLSPVGEINDGQWHQMVSTIRGTTVNVYLDGVLVSTQTLGGGLGLNDSPVAIGRAGSIGDGYEWNGEIDDVRIYEIALTATDVINQYAASGGNPCSVSLQADLDKDCDVDFKDFAIMAAQWLDCNLLVQANCFK